VYVWQGCNTYNYYEPGWSPIRELVAAGVTYSQSHYAIGNRKRAALSHSKILPTETHFFNLYFQMYTLIMVNSLIP